MPQSIHKYVPTYPNELEAQPLQKKKKKLKPREAMFPFFSSYTAANYLFFTTSFPSSYGKVQDISKCHFQKGIH